MANVKSAIKGIRVSERKKNYNKPVRTGVKTRIAKAERLVVLRDIESARAAIVDASSALDKAALKGVIHANAAARHKSRLMKKLNAAMAASV